MSDVPIHVRILASLGMAKVKKKKGTTTSLGTPTRRRRRRRFSFGDYLPKLMLLGAIIPILFLALPDSPVKDEDLSTRQLAEKIAEKEEKNEWQEKEWSNPDTAEKLANLKIEIDNADCNTLTEMLGHERWTQRAYVAHTFIEKECV